MLSNEWKHFKSGTDIRGVAIPDVDGPVDLTDEAVERMAFGFLCWLCKKSGKQPQELTISVGRDSRLSGPRLRDAVVKALTNGSATVLDCGLASTPAMFMTTVDLACDGAIQLTASHHPFQRNGLKFFIPSGGVESTDIEAILHYAQDNQFSASSEKGSCRPVSYMTDYAARLRTLICNGLHTNEASQPLKGFHIVVDAGNGAGGFYATDVLQKLGADITGSQFLEPNGRFPNHIPNPENEEAMASICAATVAAQADLGVIFDTDVDRAGCVDSQGKEINRNRLVALAAAIALESCPGGTIVTDSITSSGLKIFIEQELGGVHRRFKRGYKNVINESIRLNTAGVRSPLAIETSGHAALQENYFLDDGAYLITKIIIKMAQLRCEGKSLNSLIERLQEPAESVELRFHITDSDFKTRGEQIIDDLEDYARQQGWAVADDSCEGIRLSFGKESGNGWLLLRLSVHDPVMPLNIESDQVGGCRVIAAHLAAFMKDVNGLDTTVLTDYLKG